MENPPFQTRPYAELYRDAFRLWLNAFTSAGVQTMENAHMMFGILSRSYASTLDSLSSGNAAHEIGIVAPVNGDRAAVNKRFAAPETTLSAEAVESAGRAMSAFSVAATDTAPPPAAAPLVPTEEGATAHEATAPRTTIKATRAAAKRRNVATPAPKPHVRRVVPAKKSAVRRAR